MPPKKRLSLAGPQCTLRRGPHQHFGPEATHPPFVPGYTARHTHRSSSSSSPAKPRPGSFRRLTVMSRRSHPARCDPPGWCLRELPRGRVMWVLGLLSWRRPLAGISPAGQNRDPVTLVARGPRCASGCIGGGRRRLNRPAHSSQASRVVPDVFQRPNGSGRRQRGRMRTDTRRGRPIRKIVTCRGRFSSASPAGFRPRSWKACTSIRSAASSILRSAFLSECSTRDRTLCASPGCDCSHPTSRAARLRTRTPPYDGFALSGILIHRLVLQRTGRLEMYDSIPTGANRADR